MPQKALLSRLLYEAAIKVLHENRTIHETIYQYALQEFQQDHGTDISHITHINIDIYHNYKWKTKEKMVIKQKNRKNGKNKS